MEAKIKVVLAGKSNEERTLPKYFLDNHASWRRYFFERHNRELAVYGGPPPAPARNNSAGHVRWWSALGRNLPAVPARNS
jgi:hypothetical protein